jgi:hypothetical protein
MHALHVDRDHLVPFRDRGVQGRPQQHDAGVADQGVEPAQFGHCPLHRGRRLLLAGHIGLDDEPGPACAGDRRGELIEPVAAPRHQGHGRSLGGEPAGGGGSDPAARAGDQGDRSGQRCGHGR